MRWSRYPRNDIYRILAAGFKQQRHVDDHKRPEAVLAEKVLASLCNRRMNERFQFFQRLTIAEHFFAKRLAIDAVGTGRSRKRMFDSSAHRSEERRVGKDCVSTCRSRW